MVLKIKNGIHALWGKVNLEIPTCTMNPAEHYAMLYFTRFLVSHVSYLFKTLTNSDASAYVVYDILSLTMADNRHVPGYFLKFLLDKFVIVYTFISS